MRTIRKIGIYFFTLLLIFSMMAGNVKLVLAQSSIDRVTIEELEKLYDEYKDLNQGTFPEPYWTDFQEALQDASYFLNNRDTEDPNRLYPIYMELSSKLTALIESDTTLADLETVYNKYKDVEQGNYNQQSWTNFLMIRDEAYSVLYEYQDVSPHTLFWIIEELEESYSNLETETPDFARLETLYNEYKQIDKGNYTNESWSSFTGALQTIENYLTEPLVRSTATQADIDSKYDYLVAMYHQLGVRTNDTSELEKVLNRYEAKYGGIASDILFPDDADRYYYETTMSMLNWYLDSNIEELSQEELDEAVKRLIELEGKIKYIPKENTDNDLPPTVNTTGLQNLLNDLENKYGQYNATELFVNSADANEYRTLINTLGAIALENLTQEEIDNYVRALQVLEQKINLSNEKEQEDPGNTDETNEQPPVDTTSLKELWNNMQEKYQAYDPEELFSNSYDLEEYNNLMFEIEWYFDGREQYLTQEEVDDFIRNLQTLEEKIEVAPIEVDLTELRNLIQQFREIRGDASPEEIFQNNADIELYKDTMYDILWYLNGREQYVTQEEVNEFVQTLEELIEKTELPNETNNDNVEKLENNLTPTPNLENESSQQSGNETAGDVEQNSNQPVIETNETISPTLSQDVNVVENTPTYTLSESTNTGNRLPNTATDIFTILTLGIIFILEGIFLYAYFRFLRFLRRRYNFF